ncbi:hypothetical protein D3H65_02045 [Paraflavitalea soli]|uniref:Uncharacterized protein n=1 Tax=Paraflavitalea soli TaxID=2315862 RepID=A0A3B7MQC4_9BACT|nr:hypothetical protein [Paraflavitalea soli]AXY72821.1 hypothetical protein D3H65_02045 [Paraflavitalea soli]
MKTSALFIALLLTVTAFSQSSINNYKYVLVPAKYNFAKTDNQYGLNTLTQSLLNAKGFTAFVGNEQLPPEVAGNKCNALTAEAVEKNGLLVTKITLLLKDCQGNIVFKSKEGKSREKDFQAAYDEALRDAFTSFNSLAYKYDGTTFTQSQATSSVPAATTTAPAPAPPPVLPAVTENTGVLYAQATPNGYQLIDTSPKKVMTLLKTSLQDYFIAEGGASNGVVFKKDGEWLFEYYKDNKLISLKLQIKF